MKLSEKITQAMLEGQVRDFSDAYQGAMEEVAIWKRRALEAETLNRKFIAGINGPMHMGEPAQPAQKAVAYLDLGVGGYMDIGTDLTDEQLASLPKGRHTLGIVGTYGVDGYVSAQPGAQPAPSVPDGWLPVPEKHPTFDPVDLQLSDGSVLCGCVPQADGDYWWEGPSGEVFIDPKYANVTHWRLAADPKPEGE